MKLTQKQLASLAKVQHADGFSFRDTTMKDIQLSSVLAILDVLGMTDKRTLVFTDPEFRRDSNDTIVFWGKDGETKVCCRISRAALDDHFSENDKLRPEAAFKKHRQEIEALARRNPARIRYSAMSLPYHIGNGWFGGFLPTTAFAMVAATGNVYYGLWYPIVVTGITLVVGLLFLPETYKRAIDS